MNAMLLIPILVAAAFSGTAYAQSPAQSIPSRQESAGGREPPPQAYEDCKGKRSGETVQHTTREGKVVAICEESPKGMVARPKRPQGEQRDAKPR